MDVPRAGRVGCDTDYKRQALVSRRALFLYLLWLVET